MDGSCLVLCVDVYSEILKKPKNATTMAVHSMTLSAYNRDELNRFWLMVRSIWGVMGNRLGMEWALPCERFMPRMRRYKRWKASNRTENSLMVEKNLIAAICILMLLCEL